MPQLPGRSYPRHWKSDRTHRMRDHREAAKMIDILEHFSGVVSETERRLRHAQGQHMAGTSGDLLCRR